MALTIKCPNCGASMNIRTSDRPTPTTVQAIVYCPHCADVKAQFVGELTNIQRATWTEDKALQNSVFEKNQPVMPKQF